MTNPAMPQTIAMTPRMVAERWLCTERHVRRLIATGQLPHFKAGGKLIRLLRAEVEAYENQNSTAVTSASTASNAESDTAPDSQPQTQKKQRSRPQLSAQEVRALLGRS